MIAMNAALKDVYKKVFADSYQHGASLSRGAWKGRGDFDRMNRDQLIDEEENPGWTLFSFAMRWLDAYSRDQSMDGGIAWMMRPA